MGEEPRARDALGRPLPRGEAGIAELPADLDPDPVAILTLAQHLIDEGKPFQAHEALEFRWKRAPADERALWQGLAQLAVARTHQLRGNTTGARNLAIRGSTTIAPWSDHPPHGIDVRGLLAWAGQLLDRVGDTDPTLLRHEEHGG